MVISTSSQLQLAEKLAMFEKMVAIRVLEETARRLLEQGVVGGEVHQYIGEEATSGR